jgi:hypothetical protein
MNYPYYFLYLGLAEKVEVEQVMSQKLSAISYQLLKNREIDITLVPENYFCSSKNLALKFSKNAQNHYQ